MDHRTDENKRAFLQTFKLKAGNVALSCAAIGISRQAYYNWIADDEKFASDVDDAKQELRDLAESQLMKNILAGKEASLFFYLTNERPEKWKQKGLEFNYSHQQNILNVSPEALIGKLRAKYGDKAESVARQLATVLGISLEVRPSENGSGVAVRPLAG